ncbi:MAG: hypothetical protein VR64_09425 [Desulfatitalea sp. BRH_c12]|nr:MAG: hypothetical protein VR64_09425 [Desulfatitalea sp. BRH_c12]
MSEDGIYAAAQKIRLDLVTLFHKAIESSIAPLNLKMDPEIGQEIRERIAVLMFDEMVNDMPMVPYLSVWEDGAKEIAHAYMSPKIVEISGYSPQELLSVGYVNIVQGDIISFYREQVSAEEKVNPLPEARNKRMGGFLENRHWEGCYKLETKDGRQIWVIDRSTITRFRNTAKGNVICLSCGVLLESTELLERKK